MEVAGVSQRCERIHLHGAFDAEAGSMEAQADAAGAGEEVENPGASALAQPRQLLRDERLCIVVCGLHVRPVVSQHSGQAREFSLFTLTLAHRTP